MTTIEKKTGKSRVKSVVIEYYLLRMTREAHTGNTIIRSYNGDGTMWGSRRASEKNNKAERTCRRERNTRLRERSEWDVQLSEKKIYRYTMHARTAQE